jgi:prepilin-type N-terminal cleavage/methylation domain-containing protein
MHAQERTMTLQTGSKQRTENRHAAGFTLIELVLVMAILIVVLSMSGASLTSFFRGRTLEAEGKRLLALTRHAQNRAVSEGIPMSLWIDKAQKKYGLEASGNFAGEDAKAKEFGLGRDLEIEVTWPQGAVIRQRNEEIVLRFEPDGFIDETNPELIVIKEKNGEAVNIVPTFNRLNYEITTNKVYAVRR